MSESDIQLIKEYVFERHKRDLEELNKTRVIVECIKVPAHEEKEVEEPIIKNKKRKVQPKFKASGYEMYKVSKNGKRPYLKVYLLDWFIDSHDKVVWRVEDVNEDDDYGDWKDNIWKEYETNLSVYKK